MKIERSKDITFEYESELVDIGKYRRTFTVLRVTPSLQLEIARLKSRLMGGEVPVTKADSTYVEWVAVVTALATPIYGPGEKENDTWLEDEFLNDIEMLGALYDEVIKYQNSFYRKPGDEKATD